MTDRENVAAGTEGTEGTEGTDPAAGRPGHPTATSRARRIGGRPRPGVEAAGDAAETVEPAAETTDTTEPAAASRVQLRKPRKAARTDEPADEPAGEPAEEPVEPAAETPARGEGGPMWLPFGIAVLATAAAIVLIVLGVLASSGVWWGNTNSVRDQRSAVLSAAKSCMATMNTYDYRKLDQAEQAGLACTTGKLTAQYKTAMDKVIKPQAAKVQFTQTAQVLKAGIETVSEDGSQWTVLVFGQLSTTNSATGTKTPRLDLFSARAIMQQVHGKWLVANYQYAPSA